MKFRNISSCLVASLVLAVSSGTLIAVGVYFAAIISILTQHFATPSAPPATTTNVRYAPEVIYLVPQHNNFPAPVVVRTPEDTRLAVTGTGEIFELRLIRKSDQQIVYQKLFIFDKPVMRDTIFCLYGVEVNTGRCATIPEKDWQEGDYVFDVVASYSDGTRNSNQRQIYFDLWPRQIPFFRPPR